MTTPIYTPTRSMRVRYDGGERYEIAVRQHAVAVDQPTTDGGSDSAPTPVELFVASLAGCVAFYCGRYLSHHGVPRDGLSVTARYAMATDMPTRISDIRLTVHAPDALPTYRRNALRSVAERCTIHNTVLERPTVAVELAE
jgi:putative redox protein